MFSNARKVLTGTVAAAVLAATSVAMVPTEAAAFQGPAVLAQTSDSGLVQDVAWKKWKKYPNYGGGNYHHHHHGGGNNWVGPLVGGMVLGGILAAPYYGYGGGPYYAPAPRYRYGSHDAYCHSRFRSYNSATGLYFGYDGRYHRC